MDLDDLIRLLRGPVALTVFTTLLGAIILRRAVKSSLEQNLSFRSAYIAFLLPFLANWIFSTVVLFVLAGLLAARPVSAGERMTQYSTNVVIIQALATLPVYFFLQAGCISWRLNTPFRRACAVSLLMAIIGAGVGAIVGGILFLCTKLI